MRRATALVLTLSLTVVAIYLVSRFERGKHHLKPVEELRVRISSTVALPDPAYIESAGDWYILDHISSGLISFDSEDKEFKPFYAESWHTEADGTHVFKLRPGIRFHDGTPITTRDVLWSLKRQLLLKTSTHFPLWDYVEGCDHLKSLEENCSGLQATNTEIILRLKKQTDSFFLQLASPETGIWAASDMDPKTGKLTPTKFSGPYYFEHGDPNYALLKRNLHSPLSERFPNSPRAIRILHIPLGEIDHALLSGEVDLVVRPQRPDGESDWKAKGISVRSTTPSSIVYLYGLGRGEHPEVGGDFIRAAWSAHPDPTVPTADTFLPFATEYTLDRADFLAQLPDKTARKIRVFCPDGFYSQGFLNHLKKAAASIGSEIEYSFAPSAQWFAAFDDPAAKEKYDYILSVYAASERYPAVQLRYITGSLAKPPIDLKAAESPDLSPQQIAILKDYQRWLLKSRQAIPLYFLSTLFLYRKNIDIGAQPASDAEIELWRVQERE